LQPPLIFHLSCGAIKTDQHCRNLETKTANAAFSLALFSKWEIISSHKNENSMRKKKATILVSFGEPRNERDLSSYMQSCLQGEGFMKKKKSWLSKLFHSGKIRKEIARHKKECQAIGSFSPYCEQIVRWKEESAKVALGPLFCFFLNLPSTHQEFFAELKNTNADEYLLLPAFPQFSYAHAGKIAGFFADHLKKDLLQRFRWVKSYAAHSAYVQSYQNIIQESLKKEKIKEEDVILLFSCAGIDPSYLENGDLYASECEISFKEILKAFPFALGRLSFQNTLETNSSPLSPTTYDCCQNIETWCEKRKKLLMVPMSFVVESLSTLYEMDHLYIPLIRKKGMQAFRTPTLASHPEWAKNSFELFKEKNFVNNQMLLYFRTKERRSIL
jgi:ferrochelatase